MIPYLVLLFMTISSSTVAMTEMFKPAKVLWIVVLGLISVALFSFSVLWLVTAFVGFAVAVFICIFFFNAG